MILSRLPNLVEIPPESYTSRIQEAPIAHIPLGAIRVQGGGLPLGSDGLIAEGFLTALAREVGGVVLPPIYLWPSGGEDSPLPWRDPSSLVGACFQISSSVYDQLLRLTLSGLARAGISLAVLAGPPDIRNQFIDRVPLWESETGLRILWWEGVVEQVEDDFGIPIDQGAGPATSLLMALCPELVRVGEQAEPPSANSSTGSLWDPLRMGYADRGEKALDRAILAAAEAVRESLGLPETA